MQKSLALQILLSFGIVGTLIGLSLIKGVKSERILTEREDEELHFFDKHFEYWFRPSMQNNDDKENILKKLNNKDMHIIAIPYKTIERIILHKPDNVLYIDCYYKENIVGDFPYISKCPHFDFYEDDDSFDRIIIPLYFKDENEFVERLIKESDGYFKTVKQ